MFGSLFGYLLCDTAAVASCFVLAITLCVRLYLFRVELYLFCLLLVWGVFGLDLWMTLL